MNAQTIENVHDLNTPTIEKAEALPDKVICIRVVCRKWGITRPVQLSEVEVTANQDLAHLTGADEKGLNKAYLGLSKKLLQSARYKAIEQAQRQAVAFVQNRTHRTKMLRGGDYLLPLAILKEVEVGLRNFRNLIDGLVEDFAQEMPELQAKAEQELGPLYDANDYPDTATLKAKFSLAWSYFEHAAPAKIESIDAELAAIMNEKFNQEWEDATHEIVNAKRAAMAQLVQHLVDVLSDPDKRFKSSTIDNLKEFLELAGPTNVTDDQELAAQVEKAKDILKGISPELLRVRGGLRKTVAEKMGEVKSKLEGLLVQTGGLRAIRFED